MIGHETGSVRVLVFGQWEGAEHEEPWDRERVPRQMTREAIVVAPELRLFGRLLLERVEDDPLLRIVCSHLQHRPSAHEADRDGIGEEHRPRVAGANERAL